MKIIELLSKIANGEEDLPAIIVGGNEDKHYYNKDLKEYINQRTGEKLFEDGYGKFLKYYLNDEVEILEEKELCHKCGKYPSEYNQTYCEFCLGISEEEKKDNFTGWKMYQDGKEVCSMDCSTEEEKKIPEKLKILNANEHTKAVYYENYLREEIALDIETLQIWVNEIIDYLKSKGE